MADLDVKSGLTEEEQSRWRLFYLPKKIAKRQYEMILKSHNCDTLTRRYAFSDRILCEDGNLTARYQYADIVKVADDNKYFYLFYNEDMVLRILKSGFTVGTAGEFRQFCDTVLSGGASAGPEKTNP